LHVKAPVFLNALAPAVVLLGGCSLDQFRKDPPPPPGIADTCETRAMVDDCEDRNDQILLRQGRGGYIYTYLDKAGSTITPTESTFKMAREGAHGSKYAVHIQGKLASSGETYAGIGMDLRYPRRPYDASRYKGVSFLAKVAKGTSPFVRFKLPDANTDPDAKQCTECFNDFGIGVELSEEWTRYEVAFSELKQESGWGKPRPPTVDAKQLMALQWQVSAPGTAFDIWIDDISFIGCP
jgi:endoglucanase